MFLLPLGALGTWREAKVEIARLERVFVLSQRRIVRRHGHGEAGRQAAVEQARALELFEAGQVADRVESEMRQESLGGAESQRTPGHLAAAARLDPAGLQQHVDRALR